VLVSIQTTGMDSMILQVVVSSLSKDALDGAFGSQCGQSSHSGRHVDPNFVAPRNNHRVVKYPLSRKDVSTSLQVIVFSFSKKECEALALQMAPLDLNDESEHKLVEGIFWNAVDSLSEDDRRLPQVMPFSAMHSPLIFLSSAFDRKRQAKS